MVSVLQSELNLGYDRGHSQSAASIPFAELSQAGIFYVHCFTLSSVEAADLHGKAIPPERFRGLVESRPDPRLVKWHYSQCVKAHIRGFSAGME
jgi:hypothetical protein